LSDLDRTDRYSHYRDDDEPIQLTAHQEDVAERVRYLAPDGATTCTGTPVAEVAEVVALVHDLGKLTTAFQRHLDGESVAEPTQHAPLGALAAFYALQRAGFDETDALLGFVAVARHHGALPDVAQYIFDVTHPDQSPGGTRIPMVRDQTADIDDHVPQLADGILRSATGGAGSWDEFTGKLSDDDWLLDVLRQVTSGIGIPKTAQQDVLPDDFYDGLLPVWSTLTLADKTSAATLTSGAALDLSGYDGTRPAIGRLETEIERLQDSLDPDASDDESRVHELRNEAHDSVMERVGEFATSDQQIASLTLPTGLGKTFTGLHAGLDLLERGDSDDGSGTDAGRLIYALPFTSIIDQVAEECREVFETDGHDDVMTVDHHLADTLVDLDDLDVIDEDSAAHIEALYGESWRAGLVVTTFVQLFESLAGPSNSQSTKLPALDESVVVIDEPQALPESWWPVVRRLVSLLTEQYETQVIVMTATQPKVFEQEEATAPYPLIENAEHYFSGLDRVVFELDESAVAYIDSEPEPLDYETAGKKLLDATGEDESVLAICNTIDSARELAESVTDECVFTSLNEVYDEYLTEYEAKTADLEPAEIVGAVRYTRRRDEPVFLHLTTRHRPVDRQRLLSVTKSLQSAGVPVVAVTTQLVEAGVDISFDRVVRDLGPMSSIVQAAGRCNRSFEQDRGTVTIWQLDAPGSGTKTPSVAVYGGETEDSRPKLTARAIKTVRESPEQREFTEPTMAWDASTEYFELLQGRNPGEQSYVEYVTNAQIEQLGRQSLITNTDGIDVVVARTRAERELLEEIGRAFDDYEFDRLDELLEDVRELQVSIPLYDEASEEAKRISNLDPVHAGAELRQIDSRVDTNDAFDAVRGLSIPSETVENRFM
jgi:CRISPR-associated endonuclease/helicase Cas3/CRISPR-associated endonuclease Cas3-HD